MQWLFFEDATCDHSSLVFGDLTLIIEFLGTCMIGQIPQVCVCVSIQEVPSNLISKIIGAQWCRVASIQQGI